MFARSLLLAQGGAQRGLELRVPERVAELEGARWDSALTLGDDLRHLAVKRSDRDLGDRREGGAAQDAPERPRELLVGHRLGCGAVDRARPALAVERRQVDADEVV